MNSKIVIYSSILLLGVALLLSCSQDENELSISSDLETRSVN